VTSNFKKNVHAIGVVHRPHYHVVYVSVRVSARARRPRCRVVDAHAIASRRCRRRHHACAIASAPVRHLRCRVALWCAQSSACRHARAAEARRRRCRVCRDPRRPSSPAPTMTKTTTPMIDVASWRASSQLCAPSLPLCINSVTDVTHSARITRTNVQLSTLLVEQAALHDVVPLSTVCNHWWPDHDVNALAVQRIKAHHTTLLA
jgi:hypothetical protein